MEGMEKRISSSRAADGCQDCHSMGGFKKVLHLPVSDLDIYLHREQENLKQKERSHQTIKSAKNDIFILHNANPTELNKSTVIRELNKYKPKCMSCRGIIRRVQGLLEEIRTIRRNETYAICDHCKFTTGPKCKRCDYILSEFKSEQKQHLVDQRHHFKEWLSKVKELLQTIIDGGQLCRYGLYQETADVTEFENLLSELYPPTKVQRQPDIGAFPSIKSAEDLAVSQDLVREVIRKLRMGGGRRYSSVDSLYVSPSRNEDCVCKIFQDRTFVGKTSRELLTHQLTTSKVTLDEAIEKRKSEELFTQLSEIPVSKGQKKRPKEGKGSKALKDSVSGPAHKIVAEKKTKPARKIKLGIKKIQSQSLVAVHHRQKLFEDDETEASEEIIKCEEKKKLREMIRGLKIVPYEKDHSARDDDVPALSSNANFKFELEGVPMIQPTKSKSTVKSAKTMRSKKTAGDTDNKEEDRSGVVMYRLSDRTFIDKGWTQLPTMKTMRRMNIYKMLPASSFEWFSQNKQTMYYDSGEKLFELGENGRGFWFYRNGLVALEYYDTPDSISKKRFTVLSHEVDESKKPKSQNVLACFDYCGNGIVYDTRGNERLKYNQSEGYVSDEKIGPLGRWKWHTMNDPPVLEQIFIDTQPKNPSPDVEELMKQDRTPSHADNDSNDAMLAIELRNFVKGKVDKLRKYFKPFEIRMKAMKVNEYFSLKVIDQSNIYLLYRDGALQLKLNLGMLLQSDEIVATDFQEAGVVKTPYDRRPSQVKYPKPNISIDKI